ncbi:MAG: IS630 family transposase [Candidatus Dadabacteria bacterium]|nr:IS630 family transposase [candidate division KSB1 bacterium]NIS09983.1 IS630 family transposase [Candidatus Dadabacteria bacterium]NIS38963.1 IS630 family transposase [Candidatus Saccharibacteria bacterium]NIV04426.1 IS630 family transposase [Calditrichia bacterium]NIV72979.1 IS630 family transposase [Calditrichia bacterium]
MKKTNLDARKLPREVIEEKRRQAHKLRQRDMTRAEIGEILGVHADTVGRWLKLDKNNLKVNRGGRKLGEARLLTESDEKHIKKLIVDKTPDQMKLDYALWTRKSVQELILQEVGVDLAVRSVGEYLKRWGMTPQKPQKKAYEQRAPEVKRWLKEEYPEIKSRAKDESAEIYWLDETGLKNDCQHERGYAPRGQTPTINLNANTVSINMISAVTNQGKVRYRIFEGTMNSDVLIDFFMRLLRDAKKKVFVVMDNLRVHHSKPVKDWLEDHKAMIEAFYLPAYSPELNPDEYLNCDLKVGVHSGKPARNKKQLKNKTAKHMQKLQKKPSRVKKYFEHEKIKYAA